MTTCASSSPVGTDAARRNLVAGAIGSVLEWYDFAIVLSWPLWWLMHQHATAAIFAGQAGFGALFIIGFAGIPALMSELLPPEVRCTSIGVGYNVSIGLFGGTGPLVATYLVARTADDYMPAYYVMAAALISFIALLGLPETAGPRRRVPDQGK